VSVVDPEGAQARDRVAEGAMGQDREPDRGPVEGKRQDLVNSFRLEVPQTTDGCLSALLKRTPQRLKGVCENSISKLSPAGTAELSPGRSPE
jgi:hypothetical protein